LGILYFVQVKKINELSLIYKGLPLGFFRDSSVLILSEKGATFSELSKMSLVRYPYALNILFAPFADSVKKRILQY